MVEWEGRDPRLIRLFDLADDDMIAITCPACGKCREYGNDYFQRHMRYPSDMLLYDLRYRVGSCSSCNRSYGFGVEVRKRTHPPLPPLVVAPCDRF
jgi:hypothetical protein